MSRVEFQSNPFFWIGLDDGTTAVNAMEVVANFLDKRSLANLRTTSVSTYLRVEDTEAAARHRITRWGDPTSDGLLRDGVRMWMINHMFLHLDRGVVACLLHADLDTADLEADIMDQVENFSQHNHLAWRIADASGYLNSQRHGLWPPALGREIHGNSPSPSFFVPRAFPQKRLKLERTHEENRTRRIQQYIADCFSQV